MNREAENLFHELVDLPPEQRESFYIRQQVREDVKAEVEALLRFDAGAEVALEDCVGAGAEQLLGSSAPAKLGARCGPYEPTRLLGHGGMGSVYLGERADGEVKQRAAIKLLRYGSNEPWFRDRFLRERQILATLDHSGIARLLDAGQTADGQPFLAMDYVDGTPIDVFAQDLDLRAKLRLFLQVCEAVSYAHRNLIVHRDLKPSNILVSRSGEPKLLDFGIAKILDASLDPNADQTQTRERLLTPEFASPEQVRGGAQTTATDIYSLGAVLYKLLTGRSPHTFASGAPGEIEAAICLQDPQAPSRVNPQIPKDLDYILGKALRKEPGERYPSIDVFADDLRAFLEWRPIRARSGNTWYRTRKFLRRYRVAVGAIALTLAGLSIGLYIANRERLTAQRRFQQVRQIANKALALDTVIRGLPGGTKAREEIVAMSQEYLAGLGAEARGDQELALEVALGYIRLAIIQGVPTAPNLGRYAEAEVSLKKADALLQDVLKASPRNKEALEAAAEVNLNLMILASTDHRREEALAHAKKAAARVEESLGIWPVSPADKVDAASALTNIALAHKNLHLYADSVSYARRAVELGRSSEQADGIISNALSIQADSERFSGDLDGALQVIQEAKTLIEKAGAPGETNRRTNLFNVLWREGTILGQDGSISLDRPAEAIAVLQRAFDVVELGAEQDPNDSTTRILVGSAARELGPLLTRSDPKRALAIYDKALLRVREIKNNRDARHSEAALLAGSSYALRRLNRAAEARQRIDAAARLLRETNDFPENRINPDSEAEKVWAALADHLAETGQPQSGAATYRQLLDKITAFRPDTGNDLRDAIRVSNISQALSALDRHIGNAPEADTLDGSRGALWQGWLRKLPGNPFVRRQVAAVSAAR